MTACKEIPRSDRLPYQAVELLVRYGLEIDRDVADDAKPRYLITGNTFPLDELLLDVGAIWDPSAQVWRLESAESLDLMLQRLEESAEGQTDLCEEGASLSSRLPLDPLPARLLEVGPRSLRQEEVLEIFLSFGSHPRQARLTSARLLSMFGSLGAVVAADVDQLRSVPYVDNCVVTLLKAVRVAIERIFYEPLNDQPIIGSRTALMRYLQIVLSHEPVEQMRVLFLNKKNVLILDEVQQRGTVNHTPLYPREIVKRALELHASSLILAHNHPSGDPTPSRDDIEMTERMIRALATVDIKVYDHIIVGSKKCYSLKSRRIIWSLE